MSGKSVNFGDKKNQKKYFLQKIRKYLRQMILMLTKYQFQKKNHMAKISQLNISLNIMMMLLDHYV